MTFKAWVKSTQKDVRKNGVIGFLSAGKEFYKGMLRRYRRLQNDGMNIYAEDWDLLIILDACRVDTLAGIDNEYEFLANSGSITSVGSSSPEWMTKTFTREQHDEIQRTHHITGNIHSREYLDKHPFATLDEVWTDGWDDDRKTVRAREITDRVINLLRKERTNRVIAHYMQPHYPYIPHPELDTRNPFDGKPEIWHQLREGDVEKERILEAYRSNIRYVLDDVELLLQNVDADKVVITADHGEAFGEWGIYEHPGEMPLSVLREVPWYTTTATDQQTYEPDVKRRLDDRSVEDKLRSLGYL